MSEIVSYMSDIPEENWELAFKKKLPPKEHDGGWVEEQIDNQNVIVLPDTETNEC